MYPLKVTFYSFPGYCRFLIRPLTLVFVAPNEIKRY